MRVLLGVALAKRDYDCWHSSSNLSLSTHFFYCSKQDAPPPQSSSSSYHYYYYYHYYRLRCGFFVAIVSLLVWFNGDRHSQWMAFPPVSSCTCGNAGYISSPHPTSCICVYICVYLLCEYNFSLLERVCQNWCRVEGGYHSVWDNSLFLRPLKTIELYLEFKVIGLGTA